MSEPRRWKDSPDAPIGVRELISSAPAKRPFDDRAFRRGAERVARISAAPAAAAAIASVWTKLAAAGAIGLAAAGTVVAVDMVARERSEPRVLEAAPSPTRPG